jgi:hypothetical protein
MGQWAMGNWQYLKDLTGVNATSSDLAGRGIVVPDKMKKLMKVFLVMFFIQFIIKCAFLGIFLILFLLLQQQIRRHDLPAEVSFIKTGFIHIFEKILQQRQGEFWRQQFEQYRVKGCLIT